jgi:hypothetical protein
MGDLREKRWEWLSHVSLDSPTDAVFIGAGKQLFGDLYPCQKYLVTAGRTANLPDPFSWARLAQW